MQIARNRLPSYSKCVPLPCCASGYMGRSSNHFEVVYRSHYGCANFRSVPAVQQC